MRINSENVVVGTMIRMVRNPAIVQIAANVGLDFIMIDMEHGSFDYETVADMALIAAVRGPELYVRVPELSKGHVSRVLDCGASGVMVPMIRNHHDARKLVDWAKYAPVGERGFGSNSGHTGYLSEGTNPGLFMKKENNRVLAIAQIELKSAIEDIEAIAAVNGLDVLLVGPADLSNSLGVPGQHDHPLMEKAVSRVAEACRTNNKIFGIHAGEGFLRKWEPSGLSLMMSDMEINMLSRGMERLNQLR